MTPPSHRLGTSKECDVDDYPSSSLMASTLATRRMQEAHIVPHHKDLFDVDTSHLRPNVVDRPYAELTSYLSTHFHLLLEDVMQPFKKGIQHLSRNVIVKDCKQNFGVRLYANVKFGRGGLFHNDRAIPDCESSWRCYRVKFQPLPNFNWSNSKRLISGSLICLWDGEDEFVTGITTYSSPDELANGNVTIAISAQELARNYLEKTYLMIESIVFFEPYRAVLDALRSFTPENFPLIDYVLGYTTQRRPPAYLISHKSPLALKNANGTIDLHVSRPLDADSWPSHKQLGLDERQRQSLITALTSQVSLVQGPPGTGKTFLALQIVKTLLANTSLWQANFSSSQKYRELSESARRPNLYGIDNPVRYTNKIVWKQIGPQWRDPRSPILVVCLTNHALDQFLEGILKSTNKIVRVGGQSKSETMKRYNLSQAKRKTIVQASIGEYRETNYLYLLSIMQTLKLSMNSKIESIRTTSLLLTEEVPSVLQLKQRRVVHENVAAFFERAKQSKVKHVHKCLRNKRAKSEDPLKRWLCWENHNSLKKVARDLKLDYVEQSSKRRRERKRNEGKVKKLTKVTSAQQRDFFDDDLSDVVEDVTDDDSDYDDELPSKMKSEYQASVSSEKSIEELSIEDSTIDIGDFRDFKETQLEQLDEIRLFLGNLPLLEDSYVHFQVNEMDDMPIKQRWQLFSDWRRRYRDSVRQSLKKLEDDYVRNLTDYREKKGQSLAALCRGASVVGMTTTGAAKNRKLLEALRCKIVVVEEAAEVLESHVICSLTSDCQQLIMIGDHQQLRPSVNVHELEKKYHLDVSLFERLINVGIEPNVLGVQHRMRPEIARLITPAIYKDLKNAPTVLNRPKVPGMLHNVFFYHHEQQETRDESSYFNSHEAEMSLGLAAYLVRQDVPQRNITILATYASQLHKMQETRRRRFHWLQNVRITVVDNFQGEENEIVILSLVRNNTRSSIGFLATPNRVCVALSRARCGFYILGNMDLLANGSALWAQLKKTLTTNNQIGPSLPLTCVRHEDSMMKVWKAGDFPKKSFCMAKCGFPMKCGHPCPLPCHAGHTHAQSCSQASIVTPPCGHARTVLCIENAKSYQCTVTVAIAEPCGHVQMVPCHLRDGATCQKLVATPLPCGHIIDSPCSNPARGVSCPIEVLIKLKCSHSALVPCGEFSNNRNAEWEKLCKRAVCKQLPCGHTKRVECCKDPSSAECGKLEEIVGACGHPVRHRCQGNAPDNLKALPCEETIEITHPSCGHTQKGPCHSLPRPCHIKVTRVLECGHEAQVECGETSARCEAKVAKMLECGHKRKLACHLDAGSVKCDAMASVSRSSCPHLVSVECELRNDANYVESVVCVAMINKTFPCGHSVAIQCSKHEELLKCSAVVPKMISCGHYVELSCEKDPSEIVCSENVLVDLPCGHSTKRRCVDQQKRFVGVQCLELVYKELPCGHCQMTPCFKDPATEKCTEAITLALKCGHTAESTCGAKAQSVKCMVRVMETLPCGHDSPVPCGLPADEIKCDVGVPTTLPCGHDATVPCSELGQDQVCIVVVSKKLSCGHRQEMLCHTIAGLEVCKKCFAPEMEYGHLPESVIESATMIRAILPCGHYKDMPSYRDPSAEICFHPLRVTLSCGHSRMVACSDAANKTETRCEELVRRRLLCGHTVVKKCFEDEVACNEMCDQRLGCGHIVRVKCSVPLDQRLQMLCGFKLTRELPCGHQLQVSCGSSDAEKPLKTLYCREKVKKKVAGCGHVIETECGKNVTRKECKNTCNKCLPCGHRCKLACWEDCDTRQCVEVIDLPSARISCGHAVKGPCKLRYADECELQSWAINYDQCAATCGKQLDCGHRCPGRCSDCSSSYSHAVCQARCKRTLVCGHRCEAQCYASCPPCNKKCAYECVHGSCTNKCCEDCSSCKKPCAWGCPHRKCQHMCSEPCNREPCNEPCTNLLSCGHLCVGLCGELCPAKCPSCLGCTTKINKADRYVHLDKCGHLIEVKEMDGWIFDRNRDEQAQTRPFRLPCCPICETPVLKCFRYGDIIKDCYFDLPSLKLEYVDDVPVLESSIVRSLKFFLGDAQLSIIQAPLEQFIEEAEQLKQQAKRLNRDQLWDAVNRSSVIYEWLCLLSDVNRKYTCLVANKKYDIQLENTDQFFQIGLHAMKRIVESRSCGPEFCLSMSDLCSRLDLLRQIFVVQSAAAKFNILRSRELKRAIAICDKWQEFDENECEFLVAWLESLSQDAKLKLKSCVLEELGFSSRVSMSKDAWNKCCSRHCGAVFSTVQSDECPQC